MNEFTAKKLGEVLAFCRVGLETFERGNDALTQGLGGDIQSLIEDLQNQASQIESLAQEAGVEHITLPKSEATGTKLRSMRDLYVGDEWDNPAELLEWSGFFEGAALVHWALVVGAADAVEHETLQNLAEDGRDFHQDLLERVTDCLEQLGQQRAKA